MKLIATLGLLLVISFGLRAEEGMLIPSLISAFTDDMKAKGMKLTADEIYSVNNASLKDAILHFNGGCTAELVSGKGLLLTNHHCGFSQIQYHSSVKNDYLKYGFWAKKFEDELPNPSLYAARVVRIEDVTQQIREGLDDNADDAMKALKAQEIAKTLIEDAERGTHYKAEIKPFNYGNDFYMIVKEVFTDVRLVGAPPSSVGKFGGDTDNWVWPRHTGDFSVFRVYAGADNKPADYSEDNVPYEPLHYLPVSMKPRKNGDFTMVYGFPGTTEQHLVSDQVAYYINKERPARIGMREKSLAVIDAAMLASDETRIQYAAKQARIANAYKKWIGQIDGLKSLGAIEIKKEFEEEYIKRAKSNKEWKNKYAGLVEEMNALMASNVEADFAYAMYVEYMYVGPEIFKMARSIQAFLDKVPSYEEEGVLKEKIQEQIDGLDAFFKDYNVEVDREIFRQLSNEFAKQVAEGYKPDMLQKQDKINDLSTKIYEKSILVDQQRLKKALKKIKSAKKAEKLEKDLALELQEELNNILRGKVIGEYRLYKQQIEGLLQKYVAGKYEMFPDANHWPDANGTMRITYGLLEGSAPTDGMAYTEHTTVKGILAKHRTGKTDFDLLPDLVELYEKEKYGPYAQDGELWVCFTGSNHTTGGNSGSPVIDAEGNLMGLNFDRSWESTMSDFMFDASRCRNITVDIRYVMWVMDIYGGAGHLVKEMTIVK